MTATADDFPLEGHTIARLRTTCVDCVPIMPGDDIAKVARGAGFLSPFADEASEGCDAFWAWVHVRCPGSDGAR